MLRFRAESCWSPQQAAPLPASATHCHRRARQSARPGAQQPEGSAPRASLPGGTRAAHSATAARKIRLRARVRLEALARGDDLALMRACRRHCSAHRASSGCLTLRAPLVDRLSFSGSDRASCRRRSSRLALPHLHQSPCRSQSVHRASDTWDKRREARSTGTGERRCSLGRLFRCCCCCWRL